MSLEKALIEWCNKNLSSHRSAHNLNKINESRVVYSSSADTNINLDMLRQTGKLLYRDSTGASGYHSSFDVYQLPSGIYRVVSCDSYTDELGRDGRIRFGDFDNIKSLIMYLAFKEFSAPVRHTICCQMLLHKQIKSAIPVESGYCKEELFKLKPSDPALDQKLQDAIDSGVDVDDLDDSYFVTEYEPIYDPELVMEILDLDKSKCRDASGYFVPDLTKCDDTDVKLIESLTNKSQSDYDIAR